MNSKQKALATGLYARRCMLWPFSEQLIQVRSVEGITVMRVPLKDWTWRNRTLWDSFFWYRRIL